MTISLGKKEIIHFVGIGGIGMSGLALIMKGLGFNVKGSDQQSGKNTDRLKKIKYLYKLDIKKKIYRMPQYLLFPQQLKKTILNI